MTLNEFLCFIAGIVWGIMVVHPIFDVVATIWINAKERQNGNNR